MSDWKKLRIRLKEDIDFNTYITTLRSLFITIIFTLYNGALGLMHSSTWYGSICIYYALLIVLRLMITHIERTVITNVSSNNNHRKKLFAVLSSLLIILNLCLIGPLFIMEKQQRPVNMTLIPAIAMAAYTFYKITMSSIHFGRIKSNKNVFLRLSRLINFIDALFSIVVLQNTLILVGTTGSKITLLPFTAVSSGLIWIFIVILSIKNFITELKQMEQAS